MLRVHKDLFSPSAVQMENHSGQFKPKGHLLFGHDRIHWQGLLPTGHEQGRVKRQRGINYGKSFLKVSPKTMVDYYNVLVFRCEDDVVSSTRDSFKEPGDCVSSKDQRDFGLHIYRHFGDTFISGPALAPTHVLTRTPT